MRKYFPTGKRCARRNHLPDDERGSQGLAPLTQVGTVESLSPAISLLLRMSRYIYLPSIRTLYSPARSKPELAAFVYPRTQLRDGSHRGGHLFFPAPFVLYGRPESAVVNGDLNSEHPQSVVWNLSPDKPLEAVTQDKSPDATLKFTTIPIRRLRRSTPR